MIRLVFDFPDAEGAAGRAVLADPVQVLTAERPEDVPGVVAAVEAAAADGLHAGGYLSYEAAPAFDPAMRVRSGGDMPLAWFGLFDGVTAPGPDGAAADSAHDGGPTPSWEADWRAEDTRSEHAAAVARVRRAIAEGRTYQVNLTTRLRGSLESDPWQLYMQMRGAQGPGYHAYLDLGRHVIVSASPELFFRVRGREILTRPMKGTRPRGRWAAEDVLRRAELQESGKDRAENIMIVDLLRNDMGRVCEPGSVHVPRLMDIERYRTVWQLTSTVAGRLQDGTGLSGILAALFPCGSVTGAPKISTMELVADLERSPREVYCGAIGWIRPGGDCTFNVPIRTAWLDRRTGAAAYGTGGGIVWDSSPEAEYDERVVKAAVLREAWPEFELLETIGLVDGRYRRLERHLGRMADSAAYFGLPFPGDRIRATLNDLARKYAVGAYRARITLGEEGAVMAEALPLGARGSDAVPTEAAGRDSEERAPTALPRVSIAATPVQSDDRFLYHKTTHRRVYEQRRAGAPDHVMDVLLVNERGELTEFSQGNVVLELDDRLVTPAQSCGLLDGCLRAELLESGVVSEARIALAALERASRVWFINSARGWIQVRIDWGEEDGRGDGGRS